MFNARNPATEGHKLSAYQYQIQTNNYWIGEGWGGAVLFNWLNVLSHWRIFLGEILSYSCLSSASRGLQWSLCRSDQRLPGSENQFMIITTRGMVPLNQFYIQIKSYEVLTVNFNLYNSFSFVKGGRVEPIIMFSIHTDRSANMHWPLRRCIICILLPSLYYDWSEVGYGVFWWLHI